MDNSKHIEDCPCADMPPADEQRKIGWLPRLVGCCRVLGLLNGYRYWRLQNAAMRDPFMALRWASEIRHEAKMEAGKGNKMTAALMDCFADEMMERNRKFHTPNEPSPSVDAIEKAKS